MRDAIWPAAFLRNQRRHAMPIFRRHVVLLMPAALLMGCASQTPLPSNVTTRPAPYDNTYLATIDFSYRAANPPSFSRLKLCVAEHLSNSAVSLRDAAGSWVGPATGTYYRQQNQQTAGGGGVFKYADDATSTVIVNGTIVSEPGGLVISKEFVRFELKSSVNDSRVGLVVSNIARAQQNTGALANDGFSPVGTWPGARADGVYASLQGLANKIKGCLQ